MKRTKKIILYFAMGLLLLSSSLGCANARVRSHAGLDIVWGSHGPRVVPNIGLDVYNGGRR